MNGPKSLKGGRTVREGVSISGTAAADLERDGGGFLPIWSVMEEASFVGLSAKARPKRRRHPARHRLFRKCDCWRIVPCGRRSAAQCADITTKGIGT